MKIIYKNGTKGKVYQCKVCNNVFVWDKNSRWYGSYSDLENNPSEIRYYCNKSCYKKDNINKTINKET